MRTLIAFLCSFLFLAQARAVPLSTPTVGEIYPYLSTVCLNAGALALTVSGSAVDSAAQTITGEASFQSFACRLKVHAGRGPGIRVVSGCADVVWSMNDGTVLSVTPRDAVFWYYLPSDC